MPTSLEKGLMAGQYLMSIFIFLATTIFLMKGEKAESSEKAGSGWVTTNKYYIVCFILWGIAIILTAVRDNKLWCTEFIYGDDKKTKRNSAQGQYAMIFLVFPFIILSLFYQEKLNKKWKAFIGSAYFILMILTLIRDYGDYSAKCDSKFIPSLSKTAEKAAFGYYIMIFSLVPAIIYGMPILKFNYDFDKVTHGINIIMTIILITLAAIRDASKTVDVK
jgi:hypothetical protein